jgi:hypothetical protein
MRRAAASKGMKGRPTFAEWAETYARGWRDGNLHAPHFEGTLR